MIIFAAQTEFDRIDKDDFKYRLSLLLGNALPSSF